MRTMFVLAAVAFAAPAAPAQDVRQIEKIQVFLYVLGLHDKESGGFKPDEKGKPGLRATSAAVRAMKYSDAAIPAGPLRDKIAAFVMSCYDPQTGGFADTPGGKP